MPEENKPPHLYNPTPADIRTYVLGKADVDPSITSLQQLNGPQRVEYFLRRKNQVFLDFHSQFLQILEAMKNNNEFHAGSIALILPLLVNARNELISKMKESRQKSIDRPEENDTIKSIEWTKRQATLRTYREQKAQIEKALLELSKLDPELKAKIVQRIQAFPSSILDEKKRKDILQACREILGENFKGFPTK
jgi:hypothetical protein